MSDRRGAYGMVIPDGLCGAYTADEGGEWWCRRALGHLGSHAPVADQAMTAAAPDDGLRDQLARLTGYAPTSRTVQAFEQVARDYAAQRLRDAASYLAGLDFEDAAQEVIPFAVALEAGRG